MPSITAEFQGGDNRFEIDGKSHKDTKDVKRMCYLLAVFVGIWYVIPVNCFNLVWFYSVIPA